MILQSCERGELGEVNSYIPLELIVTKIAGFFQKTKDYYYLHIYELCLEKYEVKQITYRYLSDAIWEIEYWAAPVNWLFARFL